MCAVRKICTIACSRPRLLSFSSRSCSKTASNMSPTSFNENLHLIDSTKRAWLIIVLILLVPSTNPGLDIPPLRPVFCNPSQHSRAPNRPKSWQKSSRFVLHSFVGFDVVPDTHVGIYPDALLCGKRIICVNEAALGCFDMPGSKRVLQTSKGEAFSGVEWLGIEDGCTTIS